MKVVQIIRDANGGGNRFRSSDPALRGETECQINGDGGLYRIAPESVHNASRVHISDGGVWSKYISYSETVYAEFDKANKNLRLLIPFKRVEKGVGINVADIQVSCRDFRTSPIRAEDSAAIKSYWPYPIDAQSNETVVDIHMNPRLASGATVAYHAPCNVFRGTPNLHALIGTWMGKGLVTIDLSEDGNGIFRYSGKDPDHAKLYKDKPFYVPPDIRKGFAECLAAWKLGINGSREFLNTLAAFSS